MLIHEQIGAVIKSNLKSKFPEVKTYVEVFNNRVDIYVDNSNNDYHRIYNYVGNSYIDNDGIINSERKKFQGKNRKINVKIKEGTYNDMEDKFKYIVIPKDEPELWKGAYNINELHEIINSDDENGFKFFVEDVEELSDGLIVIDVDSGVDISTSFYMDKTFKLETM